MSIIISGKIARESLMKDLSSKIFKLRDKGVVPKLSIIQIGDRADSGSFIRAKKLFASKVGISVDHISLPDNTSQDEIISCINDLNNDSSVHGIIVQLPLPEHLDVKKIISAIDHNKDADALTQKSVSSWLSGDKGYILPATARGVKELLYFYNISIKDKKVTIIGRSDLVGKPVACMCKNEGAIVTVCHTATKDIPSETKNADIVIVAIGKPMYIGKDYFSQGQVVIDIGINRTDGAKLQEEIIGTRLVGDVDFESVKEMVYAITPVPGGVGPMTVLALFENLVDLIDKK